MLCNSSILLKNIKSKGGKVLIWGACEQNDAIVDFFMTQNIDVIGYIDQKATACPNKTYEYRSLPVYDTDSIREKSAFVYIGLLRTYKDVIECLEKCDYKEFIDYWYPHREIILDGSVDYSDLYGNEYKGENHNLHIKLKNSGKLHIGKACEFNNAYISVSDYSEVIMKEHIKVKDACEINVAKNSKIHLEKNLDFQCKMRFDAIDNSNIRIEDNFIITSYMKIFWGRDFAGIKAVCCSEIIFGKNVSAGAGLHLVATENSSVEIGDDCMLARDVLIRAGSGHSIYDMEHDKNLSSEGRKVKIGEHVWLGQRAVIFNGAEIGNGSIVGMNSFVNKPFPANCSLAGYPAKIIKNNIAWRREIDPSFNCYEDFAQFDYR